ncbi:GyrI-like domain-containing protein [Kordia sp. YSTF-M3]|uniref:GyrI-like domain-containing protein n=1 Tax=Kordia aestuariivivens TaxID=2759037 RepID=A0ABR7Q6B8_9FLAO|nr:GyrI-like domain-containing protein [Kordia aestuariivivens]MBC8754100.1 GyrI-like domain-containing protein [Kordia aestuariivivens]
MKTIKIILIVLAILVIALVAFYAYYGGFKKIDVSVAKAGGDVIIYEEIQGDYKQSGVIMDKIYYALLNEDNIETFKGFGIYYDNPQKVEKSKLRSEAGCILEEKDIDKLPMLENKYTIRTFPEKEYMITEFPYKGKISIFFSIMKVYPALNKYAKLNGYQEDTPVMEIYDIPNNKILYRKELIKE